MNKLFHNLAFKCIFLCLVLLVLGAYYINATDVSDVYGTWRLSYGKNNNSTLTLVIEDGQITEIVTTPNKKDVEVKSYTVHKKNGQMIIDTGSSKYRFTSNGVFGMNGMAFKKVKNVSGQSDVVAFIEKSLTLKNEASFVAPLWEDSLFNNYRKNAEYVSELLAKKVEESPLILSLVSDKEDLTDLKNAITYVDYNEVPGCPWAPSFVHELLKIKKVREFAASIVKDNLVELCKIYPQDFRDAYVKKLSNLLSFVKDIPNHKYTIKDDWALYVDGEKEDDLPWKLEGFVLRRHLNDKIPVEELVVYIKNTINAIKALDLSSNPKYMYVANINKTAKYTISSTGNFYQVGNNKKIWLYSREWENRFYGSRLMYRTNGKENLYTIEGGSLYNGKWNANKSKIIVDSKGEVLHKEEE